VTRIPLNPELLTWARERKQDKLDAFLSIGHRVNPSCATRVHPWTTGVRRDHLA